MPRRPSPPEKTFDPPPMNRIIKGGERPTRKILESPGSKWVPIFQEAVTMRRETPQDDLAWIHWDCSVPCPEHIEPDEYCKLCKKLSRRHALLTANSIKSSRKAARGTWKHIYVSVRQTEVWVRAWTDEEAQLGKTIDPESLEDRYEPGL